MRRSGPAAARCRLFPTRGRRRRRRTVPAACTRHAWSGRTCPPASSR